MSARRSQRGMTLVIGLVMLMVLTLLVVSAIRFSNVNLQLAGNAQVQAEAQAAAQVAVEQVVQTALAGGNLSSIPQTTTTVSTGGASYSVTVAKPVCTMTQDIDPKTLTNSVADQKCFGSTDSTDRQFLAGGGQTAVRTACQNQVWDIQASVGDGNSGAAVTTLQGVALRVGPEVSCP